MQISITLPNGELETKQFNKQLVTIGRSDQCDFVVPDESLSRKHCQIEFIDGNFFITDLGSSNGVFLDGQRLGAKTRSPFTTFMQLSIGAMECQVADTEDQKDSIPVFQTATTSSSNNNTVTRSRKMIKDTNAQTKARPPKASQKKDHTLAIIGISIVLVAGAYHFYFNQTEKIPQGAATPDTLLVEKNVPAQFSVIKDAELTAADYEVIEADKSCSEAALCKDLKLSVDKSEGVVEKAGEYFIFVHASHLELTPLIANSPLKERSDVLDLAVLYDVLQSDLFNQFQKKQIGQIHIIIKDLEYQNKRIYRFHTKYFTNNERSRLLTEMGASIVSGESANFWKYASPIIRTQQL